MNEKTKEIIHDVLKDDAFNKKVQVLSAIENNYDTVLNSKIANYRDAYNALVDFERWLDSDDDE